MGTRASGVGTTAERRSGEGRSGRVGRRPSLAREAATPALLALTFACATGAPPPERPATEGERPRPGYEQTARLSSPGDRGPGFDPLDLLATRGQAFLEPKAPPPERYRRPWTFRGPANYGGKVMDLAVTPAAPDTIYAAYNAGGVWKSTDGGDSWARATSRESANYTASVAIAPADPDTVFVGLGAPGFTMELERGVLRSTDGGATWRSIGPISDRADAVFDVLVDPADPRHLIIATEDGVFVTTNGGASWDQTLRFPGPAENWWDWVSQVVGHPEDGRIAWVAQRDLGIRKTTDGGATWQRADQGIAAGKAIVMAVSPSDPDVLYAEREADPWPLLKVYRSDDGGASWRHTEDVDYFHQGRYDLAIAVDAADPDRVFLANVAWMESTDGGDTFVNHFWLGGNTPGSAPHADHLAFVSHPTDPATFYSGNDGGVWRSRDDGAHWEKVDQGVQTNISFNLGVDPGSDRLYLTSGDYVYGQTTAGSVDWTPYPGYEWQFYEVDPHDSDVVYTSTGGHRLLRVEDGGATQTPVDPCPGQGMRYDRVVAFDPDTADVVYAGCLDLRRSTNRGDSWTSISPRLAENDNWGLIDFAVAPSDPRVIWVLTDRLWWTRDGGATWKNRALPPYPQDLAVDPEDPSVVYVSSAFEQLRRYSAWGTQEEQLWGNLPEPTVRRVVVDPLQPKRLFVANDVGVFVSLEGGGVWHRLGEGLPRVLYWDLDLDGETLYASGQQGVWAYDLAALPCADALDTMCLDDQRFQVEVDWRDFAGGTGTAKVVPFGSRRSGLFWFFSANNWEMLVKILDGCSINDRMWVFSAATTTVEYTLTVTDTLTDEVATYHNSLGQAAAAITDTEALDVCGAKARPRREAAAAPADEADLARVGALPVVKASPTITQGEPGPCAEDGRALCLARDRYEVTVEWRDFEGDTGHGTVVPGGSADSGLFWFFGESNWEMLVKVLNVCRADGHHWVFSAATTNVEYRLHVRDTVTGETATYFNALGAPARALADTTTLDGC